MPRYTTRPKLVRVRCFDYDDDPPLIPHINVPEHEEAFTGLLDCYGDEIWRQPRPIGFGRDAEW